MVWVCVSKWRDSTLVHTCDANANLNVSDIHTFSADKVRYALRFGHPNKADKVEELEDQNVYGSEKSFSKGKLRRLSSFGKRIANWRQSVLLLTYRTLSTNFSSDVISSTLSTGGVLTCACVCAYVARVSQPLVCICMWDQRTKPHSFQCFLLKTHRHGWSQSPSANLVLFWFGLVQSHRRKNVSRNGYPPDWWIHRHMNLWIN